MTDLATAANHQERSGTNRVRVEVCPQTERDTTLRALIAEQIASNPPLAIWCEPENGPTRVTGLQGVILQDVENQWARQPDWPIREARLFYKKAMLHLLAHGAGVHSVTWRESGESLVPAWRHDANAPAFQDGGNMRTSPRQLRAGHKRRGLDTADLGDWKAVEYYQAGRLCWWRLEHAQTS